MKNNLILAFLSVFSLLACTEADDLTQRNDDVVVSFTTPGVVAGEGSTRADAPAEEALGENATVRILVYRRTDEAKADLSKDTYIGENTYIVEGGVLKACVVNAAGKKVAGTATDLRLIQGKYDFYAITPAIQTKNSDHKTIDVSHDVDYATSMISASITTGSGAVKLNTLARKCSKVEFTFQPENTNVSKIEIESVELTDMTKAPVTVELAQSFATAGLSADTEDITLGSSLFTSENPEEPWVKTGKTIMLPKIGRDFKINLSMKFNGVDKVNLKEATVTNLAFAEGYRYMFMVKLEGGTIKLNLTIVNDWNAKIDLTADDLGAMGYITLNVGQWNNVDFGFTTGGDNITVGEWVLNPTWDATLGEYSNLVKTTIEGSDWENMVNGGMNSGNSKPGDWGDQNNGGMDSGTGKPNDWGDTSDTNPGNIGSGGDKGDIQ